MKRFDEFCSNLEVLRRSDQEDMDNEFIISGIINKFFIQFELSWKVLKGLLRYEGSVSAASGSPREIIKTAYKFWDFMDEDIWLHMLRCRNDLTRLYNGEAARILWMI